MSSQLLSSTRALAFIVLFSGALFLGAPGHAGAQAPAPPVTPPASQPFPQAPAEGAEVDWRVAVYEALIRLPIAAALGAVLALRPKRKGTPKRMPAVVQTQIILAVVGAVIMLVVGASLARAFGIVGAANLIRYRSKIDDPKDAGVMLCCLAVGLASGVGLYALAVVSTAFLLGVLALVESFEPATAEKFGLTVTPGADAGEFRPRLERVLARFDIEHSLRSASSEELSYDVKVPFGIETDRVTDAIQKLSPDDKLSVTWDDKKSKKAA